MHLTELYIKRVKWLACARMPPIFATRGCSSSQDTHVDNQDCPTDIAMYTQVDNLTRTTQQFQQITHTRRMPSSDSLTITTSISSNQPHPPFATISPTCYPCSLHQSASNYVYVQGHISTHASRPGSCIARQCPSVIPSESCGPDYEDTTSLALPHPSPPPHPIVSTGIKPGLPGPPIKVCLTILLCQTFTDDWKFPCDRNLCLSLLRTCLLSVIGAIHTKCLQWLVMGDSDFHHGLNSENYVTCT